MAALPAVRRDRWRAWRLAGVKSGAAADPHTLPEGSILRAERRVASDVHLAVSEVLVTGSELLLTAWLVAAVAAGFGALVALVR